jgi:small multidrug resistance family-3 protein
LKRDLGAPFCNDAAMHSVRLAALLVGAAILEVGGDALVRIGLQRRAMPMLAGAACLVAYGVVVNLGSLNFGRLMGIYIVTFFVVSQIIAAALFGQLPTARAAAAGVLMVCAAVLLSA